MRPASLLPLLLVFMLLFHDRARADCEPAACGNLTVRYPFWLGGISQSSSPCGHPAFQVWCSDDGIAYLNSSAIHVLDIDYTNNSFTAASHTSLATGDDGVCRADLNVSASIIAERAFSISRWNRVLCFLYNCSGTEPLGSGYINATSNSNCSAPEQCAVLTYVPVLGPEATAVTAANYSRLLKDGFAMEW